MMALAFAAMPFLFFPGALVGDPTLVETYEGYAIYRGKVSEGGFIKPGEVYFVEGFYTDAYEFDYLSDARAYIDELNAGSIVESTMGVNFKVVQGEGPVKVLSIFALKPTITLNADDGSYFESKRGDYVVFLDVPSNTVDGVPYSWVVQANEYTTRSGSLLLKGLGTSVVVEVPLSKLESTVIEDPVIIDDVPPAGGDNGDDPSPPPPQEQTVNMGFRVALWGLSGFTFLMAIIVRRGEME